MKLLNIHKHRECDCDECVNSVYIGRGSKWGNPFIIGADGTRAQVCDKYEIYLWDQIKEGTISKEDLLDLNDKNLLCFCYPKRCHGETILRAVRWANRVGVFF